MMIELMGSGEVFQILVISEHNYKVSDVMGFEASLFKCFNNSQQFFIINFIVAFLQRHLAGKKGD